MSDTTPPEAGPDWARPTMATAGTLTALPGGQVLELGPATPLSAAYCAEQAAACLTRAVAPMPTEVANTWLAAAQAWRELGCSMATNPTMNRPRDDDRPRR